MGSTKKDPESDVSSDSSASDDGECSTEDEKKNGHRRSPSRSPGRRHSKHSRTRSRSRNRQSRSRSRSRSPERRRSSHRKSHRSRSRSKSPRTPPYRRRSRSPNGNDRQRQKVSREDPSPSRCLGVFGMNLQTSERDLRDFFDRFGAIENVQVVYDQATHMSRGFGFVYFENVEDAIEAKNRAAGAEIDGNNVRVDFSLTKRPHTPTPGIYMGYRSRGRGYDRSVSHNGGGHRGGYRARGHRYWQNGGGGHRGESPYGDHDDDRRRRSRSVERDIY